MSSEGLADGLRVLGLGADAVAVYMCLLESGPRPAPELAARARRPLAAVCAGIDELRQAGLVATRLHGTDELVCTPVNPDTGLEVLALRKQSELHTARLAAESAYEEYRRIACAPPTRDVVEIVTDPGITDRIEQITSSARTEIRRLDSPPYYAKKARNLTEEKQLAAGIRYRVVYSQASLERPGLIAENIGPCIRMGEQARLLPTVPVKLTIVDRRMALVSLAIGEADVNSSLLVVYPCSLFSALEGLFETSWRAALPMDPAGNAAAPRLRTDDTRLLTLLAAGITDDAIARELGISRRTYFRRLSRLMARAGATNRFQLALHAARNNWC